MKYDQPLMIVLATLAFASCSSVNVRTEHDPRTNFAKYRTYSWAPLPKSEQVQVSQYTDWGYGGGYSYRYGGYYHLWPSYPISYAQVTRYTEGTLIVDFVDAKTATSIWRGTATGTVGSAQSNQQKIREAIRKMLETIPPRG